MIADSESKISQSDSEIEEGNNLSDAKILSRHSVIHMDFRVMWIRDKVVKFLGLSGHELLFYKLLNENNRYFEDKLLNFLILDLYGITDLERKVIFFYKTTYAEIIQEEVAIWERKIEIVEEKKEKKRYRRKGKKSKGKLIKTDTSSFYSPMEVSSLTLQSGQLSSASCRSEDETDLDEEEEEEEVENEEEGEEGRETGSGDFSIYSRKKTPSRSITSEVSNFVPPPGEEHKYIMTKKMVEKVQTIPVLHMICGNVDASRADLQNTTLYYFMRTSDEGVPPFDHYRECIEQITKYIIVGSLHGKFLDSMNRILTQVFKPLVNSQFRGPQFRELYKHEGEDQKAENSTDSVTPNLIDIMQSRGSLFRRPSEFRRLSLVITQKDTDTTENSNDEDTDQATSTSQPKMDSKLHVKYDVKNPSSFSSVEQKVSIVKPSVKDLSPSESVDQSKSDILSYLEKLISSVERTVEHIEGDILLTMPNISELDDPEVTDEMLEKNKEVIEQLENVTMSWGVHIQRVVEAFQTKVPQGKGPLAELDYWQDRETGLLMLVEQLKTPMAKRILDLLNRVLSPIASNFEYFYTDLWKYYAEARDNNKFLETIVRHFKLIAESDSFKTIAQIIPSLTEGLRMIWVLSSYYSSEEKMFGLLQRISWQFCENVIAHLSLNELFKKPLEEIIQKTEEARAMLKGWKESYLKNREEIELSGKGVRWEFDQVSLFKGTEYIASVCKGLNEVASVLQDFYNIFGPHLKAIISDPAQIDTIIKRVGQLIKPIQEADFNVFDEFNKENWEATMKWFYERVYFLENEAQFFIDECFMVLINAEEALGVLLKFKNMKTRDSIHQQLLRKFDVIMQQFSKEVSTVEGIYNRGKRNPPLLSYHPPMAGAIYWVRQLLYRLKRPVMILQNVPELKYSELKLLAFSQYYEVAKQMKAFEEIKFNSWADKAQRIVMETMKKSILKMVRVEPDKTALTFPDSEKAEVKNLETIHMSKKAKNRDFASPGSTPMGSVQRAEAVVSKQTVDSGSSRAEGSKIVSAKGQTRSDIKGDGKGSLASQRDQKASTVSSSLDKQGLRGMKVTWTEFMTGSILVECQLRFEVNFDWDVFEIIHEAELMEQLGFELSPVVRDMGIQKDRLRYNIEATKRVIDQYNGMIDNMDKADIQLLKKTLLDLEKHIQPGVMRFTWNSLNIADYASKCEKLLKNLSSIVDQVNHMRNDLDNKINSELQTYNLFSLSPELYDNEELFPCKTYFQEMQSRRTELVTAMSKVYHAISPILIKLESLVLGTATGRSPAMQLFYEQYEKKVFSAFIKLMLGNLQFFNKMITSFKAAFQIDLVLIASEAVLRPSPGEIYNIILQNVKNLLEQLRHFPRWMNETCLESKLQKKSDTDHYIGFTFFEDVLNIQAINDCILMIQASAHRIALECWHYLDRWKKYSTLWSFDKRLAADKFSAAKPTLFQYNEKFTFYGNILEELKDMEPFYDLFCIRINLQPLLAGIEQHANEWKQTLGSYLLVDTVQEMNDLQTIINNFRTEVELVITGLDRFTSVMQAISDVKKTAIQAEVQYTTYQETFRTFHSHGIEFPEENEQMAQSLQRDWESLYLGALYRASTLESTCDRFSDMTQEQIRNFVDELHEFAEDFKNNGPGSVGENMDLGLQKMEEYEKLISKYEERRLSMINSELLFDLPATDYTVFLDIKKDFEGMEMLFQLYKQQKAMRNVWAKTLWVNLNPQQLIDGMDHFIREYRKLPKYVKNFSIGQALDANMKNFKNSVPLFIELKNEAMRERHWKELMRKTGQYFDMDPDRSESDS